jgi:hemoglobin/transferrin/lactoferrin receptor protein
MKFTQASLTVAIALAISSQVLAQGDAATGTTAETARAASEDSIAATAQNAEAAAKNQSSGIKRDAVIEVIDVVGINKREVDDFDDLVRTIPGVTMTQGDDRWGASGFNIRGLDEDRVAINVDGVPQGETLKYEGGQAYGYFKGTRNGVDVEALKAVEIVKGSDAILSGSGSLAGAVSMTTKDPEDYLESVGNDFGMTVKTGYNSINEQGMGSIVLANRTGNIESLLLYTKRKGHEFENYDMNGLDTIGSLREIPDPMSTNLDSVLAKVIYEFRPQHTLEFAASYYEQNRISDMQSFNGGWYANRIGDDYSTTRRYSITHEYATDFALFDTITTTLARQEVGFEANTRQSVTILNAGPRSADEDRVDTRSFDQELWQLSFDLEKAIAVGSITHNLVYGVEQQRKEFTNAQLRTANSRLNTLGWVTHNIGALIPQAEAEIATLYALDTFDVSTRTQLRIGARYDDYTYDAKSDSNYTDLTGTLGETDFSTASWTAGVEQILTDGLTLELGVSTGFRAPTIEDMYSTSGTATDWNTVANPDLKAEYSTNLDVALRGEVGNFANWRTGLFYTRYEDFIDYVATTGINSNTGELDLNGYSVPTNFNEVDMRGVEVAADIDLETALGLRGFTTSILGAYTDGENANGDPVYSVQPYRITWTLGYVSQAASWGINLYTSHSSGKKPDDAYITNSDGVRKYPLYLSNTATVSDLMGYVDLLDGLRLSAAINNLTDKEYYNWDSVRFLDQGNERPGIGVTGNGIRRYSEAGRNYELSLNYQF